MVKFNYTITAQQGKRKCPIKQIITMLCGSFIRLITIGCNSLNKGYGADTCSVFGSTDGLNYISVRKKMFNLIRSLSFVTFERIFKQKQEQAIKRKIKLGIKQNIKQIFPFSRSNRYGITLKNCHSKIGKRLFKNGANSNDLFYEVVDKVASGYGPKGYDFKPKWSECKNKKARCYSSTDMLHILDYLLKK